MIDRMQELLEAERAGVKCLSAMADSSPEGEKKDFLVFLRNDEGRKAVLRRHAQGPRGQHRGVPKIPARRGMMLGRERLRCLWGGTAPRHGPSCSLGPEPAPLPRRGAAPSVARLAWDPPGCAQPSPESSRRAPLLR